MSIKAVSYCRYSTDNQTEKQHHVSNGSSRGILQKKHGMVFD